MKTLFHSYKSYLAALLFVCTLLLQGCGKDGLLEPSERLYGQVINRVIGEGIPNIRVELWKPTFQNRVIFKGELIQHTMTNENGEYEFTGEINGLSLQLAKYKYSYQDPVWVNSKIDSVFYIGGTIVELNESTSTKIDLELYPKTKFKVICTNIAPSTNSDIIRLVIHNMKKTGYMMDGGSGIFDIGRHSHSITGDGSYILEGETKIENELYIQYYIQDIYGIRKGDRQVTCEPGGTTDILIEY